MNWFKIALNGNIPEDSGENPNQNIPLGKQVFQKLGVWLYPFNKVKKDNKEGWYLDWFNDPGSIHDINDVSVGDKIADRSLNMTPYWQVSFINSDTGRIFVNPIEPNPFVTGVGAGGKTIDEWDMSVFSGDHEIKRIDGILQRIKDGTIVSIKDIAYLLEGTVPVHMGPNGAQGGWYSPESLSSNRGGQKGMTDVEIMMADAKTARDKFGFDVPKGALDGTIEPSLWSDFIQSGGQEKHFEKLKIDSENFKDMNVVSMHIIKNPQLEIKERNTTVLLKMLRGSIPEEAQADIMDHSDKAQEIYNKYWNGGYGHPEIAQLVKDTAIQLAKTYHPKQKQLALDPYWLVKEKFILQASKAGWKDVLQAYEEAQEYDNRKYVAEGYTELGETQGLVRMENKEEHPSVLYKIIQGLRKLGYNVKQLINQHKTKYDKIQQMSQSDPKSGYAYYAEDLRREITSIERNIE